MAPLKAPDIRVVLGRGGSGKSYLVASWLKRSRGRVLIYDPNGEDLYAKGATVIETAGALVDAYRAEHPPRRIAWRGLATMGRDAFEWCNEVAWAAENLTLVWEEVDGVSDAGKLPDRAFKLVNQGRHRRIRLIACSRRPARVSRDLTANASRLVVFRTREPRDLKYLGEFVDETAAMALPDLADYHAVDWREGHWLKKKSPFA